MKTRKFFSKLFLAYIFITFLYTFVASGLFFYKSEQMIELEMNNVHHSFLRQNRDQIDTKLKVISSLAEGMKMDEYIRKYAADSELNYYDITKIYNELTAFTHGFSDIGFMIAVTKFDNDMVISSKNTSNVDRFFKELAISKDDQQSIIAFFKDTKTQYGSMVVTGGKADNTTYDTDQTISIFQKHRLSNRYDIMFVFTYYAASLMPEWDQGHEEAFAIIDRNRVIAAKTGWREDVNFDKILSVIRNPKNGVIKEKIYVKDVQKTYSVYIFPSQVNKDIVYVYLAPDSILRDSSSSILLQAFVLYALLMILGTGIAFFIAKKTYKPIGNIVNVFKNYGDTSNPDELSFIEETAAAIRKANEELRLALLNDRRPLKTKFLRELVNGLVHRSEIDKYIEAYELTYLRGPLTLIILEYVNEGELDENYDKEVRIRLRKQVRLIFEEQLKKSVECEVFELNYKSDVVLIKEEDQEKIKKFLFAVLTGINANSELSMVAALCKPVPSVYELDNSFFQALKILEYRSPMDRKMILTAEDMLHVEIVENYYYPLDTEKDLINAAIWGKKDNAIAILDRIFDENFEKRKLSKSEVAQFIFSIGATLKRILQKLNIREDVLNEDFNLDYMEKDCDREEALREKIYDFFIRIIDKVNHENNGKDSDVVERMLCFIHEHYNSDISLDDIAAHFNLSSGYVSTLFKNYTKNNYKNYLNRYRIEKAKDYLRKDKAIKVKALAGLVGCNNTNTFIRMFKKYEGVSPGQYAERLDEE
ncbi:MAG: helix-turn-helix domain-containing protein [Bacillota bacterium]